MSLPDPVVSNVESASGNNDGDYEDSKYEIDQDIITEEDSEGESDQKAVREPTKRKSKVGPLSKCPPEFK